MKNILLLCLLCMAMGGILGYNIKQCPSLVTQAVIHDTVVTYEPITGGAGTPVVSYPQNYITEILSDPKIKRDLPKTDLPKIGKSNNVPNKKDTSELKAQINTIQVDSIMYGFTSIDTLRLDSLFVAIIDTGNCSGIIRRNSVFGGKIKAQTITNTITKVVEKPIALFQLNGGVQSSFINQWQVQDIGPALQLHLKQKYSFGYSYMIGARAHNLTLLTKIK